MSRIRPILARVLLLALLAAAFAAGYQLHSFRTGREPADHRAEHRQVRLFVERVGRTTERGAAIAFEVPPDFRDEQYVYLRFQYLLPGRHVVSPLARHPVQPDYLAMWRVDRPPDPPWRLVWSGGGGTLWVRGR